MQRFFFHVITCTSRYEDDTGAMLGSLEDVMLHGRTIAHVLTKHWAGEITAGHHSSSDDYVEVEDEDSKFLITLPFVRLLKDGSQRVKQLSDPIDLNEYRLARHYARVLAA
jgi:hypothetical protein